MSPEMTNVSAEASRVAADGYNPVLSYLHALSPERSRLYFDFMEQLRRSKLPLRVPKSHDSPEPIHSWPRPEKAEAAINNPA